MDVFGIILPIVYILAGCALVWFIVELALAVRKVRATVVDIKQQVDPALANVNKVASQLPPIVEKVDPLMDRVTLTVDSVNLELMRVDEMLEDITQITGTVSKATTAVDSVTSAPLDIVANMTNRVRGLFKPKYASQETEDLGVENSATPENPIVGFASAAATAAGDAVREQRDIRADRKQEAQKRQEETAAKNDTMRKAATTITDEVLAHAQADSPDAGAADDAAVASAAAAAEPIQHPNPIDPSLYAVEDASVLVEEPSAATGPVIEGIGEVLPGDASVRVSGDILMSVETGTVHADLEESPSREG